MGAAGDMLTAALLETACQAENADGKTLTAEEFVQKFHQAGIPGVKMQVEKTQKCGITGTHIHILVDGVEEGEAEAEHSHMHEEHAHDHGHDEHAHSHVMEEHVHENWHDEHVHSHVYEESAHDDFHEEHTHHHEDDHEHHHHHDHDHGHHEHHDHGHGHGHSHDHGHHHGHVHRSMQDMEKLVAGLHLPEEIKQDVISVYKLIAEAEGTVHGLPAGEVHFHEVGTMDAVADITAVCMLIREIGADKIVASPVATGYGSVRCAHGILPVPAPATALLLRGVPSYAGDEKGELCTPTGAALVKYFAEEFSQMPMMRNAAVGYGIGSKNFKKANCLRVFLGEEAETGEAKPKVSELSCNIDDMTGEEIGYAGERLFEAGALDVYTIPIYMKKNRPGVLLRVISTEEKKDELVRAIFRYTSTIGIRENVMERYVLHRDILADEHEGRTIRKKDVVGYGVSRSKWEYEDLAECAEEWDCSLREAAERLQKND